MNQYEYKVTNLTRDLSGIVVSASFTITASDGSDSFTHTYNTGFANKPVTPVAFEDLTEEKIIGWIKRDAGESNMFESSADAELAAYKERMLAPVVNSSVPWQ